MPLFKQILSLKQIQVDLANETSKHLQTLDCLRICSNKDPLQFMKVTLVTGWQAFDQEMRISRTRDQVGCFCSNELWDIRITFVRHNRAACGPVRWQLD